MFTITNVLSRVRFLNDYPDELRDVEGKLLSSPFHCISVLLNSNLAIFNAPPVPYVDGSMSRVHYTTDALELAVSVHNGLNKAENALQNLAMNIAGIDRHLTEEASSAMALNTLYSSRYQHLMYGMTCEVGPIVFSKGGLNSPTWLNALLHALLMKRTLNALAHIHSSTSADTQRNAYAAKYGTLMLTAKRTTYGCLPRPVGHNLCYVFERASATHPGTSEMVCIKANEELTVIFAQADLATSTIYWYLYELMARVMPRTTWTCGVSHFTAGTDCVLMELVNAENLL